MIDNLMLKKEYFPLEFIDYSGKPFENELIIPPLHKSIVENGIDLNLAYSVIDEAVENSLLDIKESKIRNDIPYDLRIPNKKLDYGKLERDEHSIYYPTFPLTHGLCIQKNRISPYGIGDGFVIISKDNTRDSYFIPKDLVLPEELLEEYGMEVKLYGDFNWIFCNKGWYSHNVDWRDVFYKNFIIALNNAVVKKKYS